MWCPLDTPQSGADTVVETLILDNSLAIAPGTLVPCARERVPIRAPYKVFQYSGILSPSEKLFVIGVGITPLLSAISIGAITICLN